MVTAVPGFCSGDTFIWTDTTSGIPGTTYSLTTSPTGCTTCSVSLAINTGGAATGSNTWYIDWIQFKFDQGTNPDLFNLSGPSGNWNIADKVNDPSAGNHTANVLNPGGTAFTIPVDGFSALYAAGILASGPIDITQGLLVNGNNNYSFSFNLTFLDGSGLNSTPSIRVGYYDGLKNNDSYFFTQMSQKFQVPEPAGLALMASGLLLAAGFLRWKLTERQV